MAIRALSVIKSWFETGKKPTQAQYSDVFDSMMHRTDGDNLPITRVEGLSDVLDAIVVGPGSGEGTAVIDDLVTGGALVALSAQQGVVLKVLVDSFTNLLTSNDTTLDELQEIVDYIKTNRADLDALSVSSIIGLQTALAGKAHVGLSNLIYNIVSVDSGVTNTSSVNFSNLGFAIAIFQFDTTNAGALSITQPNNAVISIVDSNGSPLVGGEISVGSVYLATLHAYETYSLVSVGVGVGGGSNMYNADGTITEAERIVSIPASRNIVFQGFNATTDIGSNGFESASRDGLGNETALENRNGVLAHRSDLNKPIKSLAYYAPTADEDYAQKKYVTDSITAAVNALVAGAPGALDTLLELSASLGNDANFATTITNLIAKKENKTLDVVGSFSGGLTCTVTTGQGLTEKPRFLEIVTANVNTGVGVPTLNVDGTGALELWDTRTDALHVKDSIPNGKKFFILRYNNRYYTQFLEGFVSNINEAQTGNLSANNFLFSKNFLEFPNQIPVRFSATNPNSTPQASLIVAGAIPVLISIVDQYGENLNSKRIETGRLYIAKYNTISAKFELQGVFRDVYLVFDSATSGTISTSIHRKMTVYDNATAGTRTLGLGILRVGQVAYFHCKQNNITFSGGSGITLNPLSGGGFTCPSGQGKIGIYCETESIDGSGNQVTATYNLI